MFKHKKIIVVMPAYNAAKTLRKTYEEVMGQNFIQDSGLFQESFYYSLLLRHGLSRKVKPSFASFLLALLYPISLPHVVLIM